MAPSLSAVCLSVLLFPTVVQAAANDDFLSQWFALPAVFVVFRETLEATVLVAVLVQYLRRAGQHELEKSVWSGAVLGGLVSFLIGVVLLSVYYATASQMDQEAAAMVEGSMLLFASVVITYFFVTHLAPGMKTNEEWTSKWEKRLGEMVDDALEGNNPRNFFILTFTTVLREGIEAVIFIIGIGAMYTPAALILPTIAGVIVGCVFGFALFTGSAKLDMSNFFIASAGFLLLVSAGLAAHASYEFQKAGAFGTWACPSGNGDDDFADDVGGGGGGGGGDIDFGSYRHNRMLTTARASSCDGVSGSKIAWVNQELWDITDCCDTRDNMFFFLVMILFWYRPAPTNMEALTYVAYLVITIGWGYGVVSNIKDDLAANALAEGKDGGDAGVVEEDAEQGDGEASEAALKERAKKEAAMAKNPIAVH